MTDVAPFLMIVGIAGLVLGSYAVTAGLRCARAEGSALGRSRCDACGATLGFLQTIPVASYLGLKGSCRACGAGIDPVHLLGELSGAAVLVSAVWGVPPARAAVLAILGLTLLAASAIDAKVQRLPDKFTMIVALCCAALAVGRGLGRLEAGAIAAFAAAMILLGLRRLGDRLRGEPGLGLGDVKLIAALSLWLGSATPAMVALAALFGLLAAPLRRKTDGRLPFGPPIALAAWLTGMVLEHRWISWVP